MSVAANQQQPKRDADEPRPRADRSGKGYRYCYSIPETMEATGLSRQTLYNEINNGRLKTFKVGRRRMVSHAAIELWILLLERLSQ
jgi:excisionase family DNA binding protein